MDWNRYFMSFAALAAQKSKDPSTQIGVVIVKDQRVISTGYNGLPIGVLDSVDWRNEKPEKYFWYEHGERNAIYSAARAGISTKDSVMYCACNVPCADCARAIIQAGIKRVVFLNLENSELWADHSKRSCQMFGEAGVELQEYLGEKLGYLIKRGGEVIHI